MNEINYFIIDGSRNILDHGLELVYTIHHFIQGVQFHHLKIEPAPDTYDLTVPIPGATDQENPAAPVTVQQIKKISLDENVYYLVCYTLDGEAPKNEFRHYNTNNWKRN